MLMRFAGHSPARSVYDLYRVELAPFAQRLFCGFRFEIIPALEDVSSYHQSSKFPVGASFAEPVGASFAEDVSDLIEIVRQKLAREVQHHRLAETELSFVGDRDV